MTVKLRIISAALSSLFMLGCEPRVPPGRIQAKNDSQDREYNVLQVSAQGRSFTLKPGESTLLPLGSRQIAFSRRYATHTRRYVVECPPLGDEGISIKLIDVHLNRIAGGCKTISGGKE